jgi:hypothetical protein
MKDNGGSAFPEIVTELNFHTHEYENTHSIGGMTLRDYFAAKAMQGLMRDVAWDYSRGHCNAELVSRAYIIADQMLNERNKS